MRGSNQVLWDRWLAGMFRKGEGGETDFAQARKYYLMASEQGYSRSQTKLGEGGSQGGRGERGEVEEGRGKEEERGEAANRRPSWVSAH